MSGIVLGKNHCALGAQGDVSRDRQRCELSAAYLARRVKLGKVAPEAAYFKWNQRYPGQAAILEKYLTP